MKPEHFKCDNFESHCVLRLDEDDYKFIRYDKINKKFYYIQRLSDKPMLDYNNLSPEEEFQSLCYFDIGGYTLEQIAELQYLMVAKSVGTKDFYIDVYDVERYRRRKDKCIKCINK